MEFVKAGPNKRVCAFLIDNGLISIIGIWLWIAWKSRLANLLAGMVLMLLKDALAGQSIGKHLTGLRVADENGSPPKVIKTILRNIFLVIPLFPLIEYFVMLKNKQGRRLGDKLAGTWVLDLKPQVKDKIYLWLSLLAVMVFTIVQVSAGLYIYKKAHLFK